MRMNEHDQHCKAIADELLKVVNGELYTTEDGDEIDTARIDPSVLDEYLERMEAEPVTMWEYFSDCLDVDYLIDSNFDYKGVRVLVTCGGPNIYVSTITGKVELYWWTDRGEFYLEREVIDSIDEVFSEYYEMNRL